MISPRIHTFPSKEEAAKHLATSVVGAYAKECIEEKRAWLLLFSGGSVLSILPFLPVFSAASSLTLSVVDERDDPTGQASNFQALRQTVWFRSAIAAGASSIDPLAERGLSLQDKAAAFEQMLRHWRKTHPQGSIVTILGMGSDGHTAGIFPMEDPTAFAERFQSRSWVTGSTVPEAPVCPARITTTLTFLQEEASRVYVFLCGPEKAPAWKRLLLQEGPLSTLPLLKIAFLEKTEIFTDLPKEREILSHFSPA